MIEYVLAIFTLLLILAIYIWHGVKAIEAAEAEYDADPEGYDKKYPETREMF